MIGRNVEVIAKTEQIMIRDQCCHWQNGGYRTVSIHADAMRTEPCGTSELHRFKYTLVFANIQESPLTMNLRAISPSHQPCIW